MNFTLRTLASAGAVLLSGILVSVSAFAALDPADIIAIWQFDEGEGDAVNDASGNPHNLDGTLQAGKWVHDAGDKPKWVDGKFGKALKCEGAGSVIVVPNLIKDERLGPNEKDEAAGNLPDETEITITAWVQRNDAIDSFAQRDLFSFEPAGPWDRRIMVHFPWDDGEGEFVM